MRIPCGPMRAGCGVVRERVRTADGRTGPASRPHARAAGEPIRSAAPGTGDAPLIGKG
jgi:hypothetical protein